MSVNNKQIIEIIFSAIDEINSDLVNKKIKKSTDAELYGNKELLDSFELVNFIVLIEEKIIEKFSVTISLTDDKALSQDYSPFGTVKTLIEYISKIIDEQNN